MKKIILISICCFSLYMNSNGREIVNNDLITTMVNQSGDWESLGNISAISQYGENKSFALFVKVIGGKEFYQVRPLFNKDGYIPKYSVTRGNYTFKGGHYNAKFSVYSTTYYFNI